MDKMNNSLALLQFEGCHIKHGAVSDQTLEQEVFLIFLSSSWLQLSLTCVCSSTSHLVAVKGELGKTAAGWVTSV